MSKQPHKWVKSTLGHGEMMCVHCKGTNREIAVIGDLDHCDDAPAAMPLDAQPPLALTVTDLAQRLAEAIAKQVEIDNLGDCESVVLMRETPTLNLVEIAETILAPTPSEAAP